MVVIFIKETMEMNSNNQVVLQVKSLGFPWETLDPFLFCVYHDDSYPEGNDKFGPAASLEGRNLGNDFVEKDGWRMYHGKVVPGFPVHPHRGFETVTVVRKGIVDHSDSLGGAGRYGHGDVQWMTAGKGIQHSEMFPLLNKESPNPLELFQIWLNLPARNKMVEPHYTMLWDKEIPKITETDPEGGRTRIEIVAGQIGEHRAAPPAPDSWAAQSEHEVAIWYLQMEPNASWILPPATQAVNRMLFFFQGAHIQFEHQTVEAGHSIRLHAGRPVQMQNGPVESRLLMLQGKPIGEPVANYGPFVMNTRSEIQQTYIDYQATRFGGWPWPVEEQVHSEYPGRFARFTDGREEFPD
jgi:redox-sensitive bicupin YhaK (pirin superfamily)